MDKSFRRSPLGRVWLLAGVLVGVTSSDAYAQFGQIYQPFPPGKLLDAPRSVMQYLRRAKRDLKEQRYSTAVLQLGKLLLRSSVPGDEEDVSNQDYFLDGKKKWASQSFLRHVEDLLGQVPDEGLDIYELNYGPAAKKELLEATTQGDWNALKRVSCRYFHTQAGYQATFLWAARERNEGRLQSALMILSRLAAQRRAAEMFGTQLDIMLASVQHITGRSDKDIVASFRGKQTARYELGGKLHEAPTPGSEKEWINALIPEVQKRSFQTVSQYPMFGGNPSRNGLDAGELPLSEPLWKVPTTTGRQQEEKIKAIVGSVTASGDLPAPSWTPLLVGTQVLMRTTERVMGVDLKTGRRIWEYPWTTPTEGYGYGFRNGAQIFNQFRRGIQTREPREQNQRRALHQRICHDLPYGRLTSDGTRLYLLDDLRPAADVPVHSFGRNARSMSLANTLVALELKTEGKLLWKMGANDESGPFSKAFFLGPPLPVAGNLYAIAEVSGDIFLLCLDPDTGNQRWRQQLLTVESGGIGGDSVRRLSGAFPAYKEGILVCPTGNGALIAMDVASQSLLWAATTDVRHTYSYDRVGAQRLAINSVEAGRFSSQWLDGTPVIVGGQVFVTPIKSERLYSFDLLTGKPAFPAVNRNEKSYLAGVRGNKVILVGPQSVAAHDRQTGKRVWLLKNTDDTEVSPWHGSGRGCLGENRLFLPTTDSRILAIDLSNGQIIDTQQTNYEVGNLSFANGLMLSQGATELVVSYGQQSLGPAIKRLLSENPANPKALLSKAKLLFDKERHAEALECIQKAQQLAPESEGVRKFAVRVMLRRLQDDFANNINLIKPLKNLVYYRKPKGRLYFLLIQGALEQGKPLEAVEDLLQFSEMAVSMPLSGTGNSEIDPPNSRNCTVSINSWITGKVAQVLDACDEQERKKANQRIAQQMISPTISLRKRSTQLDHFYAADGVDPIRLESIDQLVKEGAYLKAERLALKGINGRSDPNQSDRFRQRLVSVYDAAGMHLDAREFEQRLSSNERKKTGPATAATGESEPDASSAQKLAETADHRTPKSALSPHPSDDTFWPRHVIVHHTKRSKVSNVPLLGRDLNRTPKPVETLFRRGAHFQNWTAINHFKQFAGLQNGEGAMATFQNLARHTAADGLKQAIFDGGLMICITPHQIIAVDLFSLIQAPRSVRKLWSKNWRDQLVGQEVKTVSDGSPFGNPRSSFRVSKKSDSPYDKDTRLGPVVGEKLFMLNAGDVQAIDVLTGQTYWHRPNVLLRGHLAVSRNQIAAAGTGKDGFQVAFLSPIDGALLETKPWPKDEKIWLSAGKHFLSYSRDQTQALTIRLRDCFTDTIALEKSFPSSAATRFSTLKGCVTDGRFLTSLGPDGKLFVWDLVNGHEIANLQLKPLEQLNRIWVVRRGSRLIVMPELRPSFPSGKAYKGFDQIRNTVEHRRVDGPVVCISLVSGEKLWEHTLKDGPWGINIGQASGSPLLLLSRYHTVFPRQRAKRKRELNLLAVDIRNGAVLDRQRKISVSNQVNAGTTKLSIDRRNKRVDATFHDVTVSYQFTDQSPVSKKEQPEDELTKKLSAERDFPLFDSRFPNESE